MENDIKLFFVRPNSICSLFVMNKIAIVVNFLVQEKLFSSFFFSLLWCENVMLTHFHQNWVSHSRNVFISIKLIMYVIVIFHKSWTEYDKWWLFLVCRDCSALYCTLNFNTFLGQKKNVVDWLLIALQIYCIISSAIDYFQNCEEDEAENLHNTVDFQISLVVIIVRQKTNSYQIGFCRFSCFVYEYILIIIRFDIYLKWSIYMQMQSIQFIVMVV